MQLPSLRPERARTLFNNGLLTVDDVSQICGVEQMVKIFARADGFVTHRNSNSEDLSLKYEYLYSLSHKVLSEAKALILKRRYDPDCTANNYLANNDQKDLLIGGGTDFMILSESSESSISFSDESLEQMLDNIQLSQSSEPIDLTDLLF